MKDQINSGDYDGNCKDPNILANLIKVQDSKASHFFPQSMCVYACMFVCQSGSDVVTVWQVFFRELPVNVLNMVSDESIHKIARMTPQQTIAEMETVFGDTNEVVYWLLDLMVRSCVVLTLYL